MVASIFWEKIQEGECSLMPPTRVCADFSATFSVRKSVCTCAHVFPSKKRGPMSVRKFKRVGMGIKSGRCRMLQLQHRYPPLGSIPSHAEVLC